MRGPLYIHRCAFKIFSLPVPTRPGTLTFWQVPDPSRPEVKNPYPSDPVSNFPFFEVLSLVISDKHFWDYPNPKTCLASFLLLHYTFPFEVRITTTGWKNILTNCGTFTVKPPEHPFTFHFKDTSQNKKVMPWTHLRRKKCFEHLSPREMGSIETLFRCHSNVSLSWTKDKEKVDMEAL